MKGLRILVPFILAMPLLLALVMACSCASQPKKVTPEVELTMCSAATPYVHAETVDGVTYYLVSNTNNVYPKKEEVK